MRSQISAAKLTLRGVRTVSVSSEVVLIVRLGTCLVMVVVWLCPGELEDGKEGEESNGWVACVDGEVVTLWL